ncbi:MAG: ATPase RavA [Candidatus Latescibacteria bacterium ADurb.Bin168]|nr:MAG: ATPase RavA [Candidatus Latescibacteria bacterium ADurb.Bin168]
MSKMDDLQLFDDLQPKLERVRTELANVIVGQKAVIDHLLIGLLSGGHCLIVGVPGLAKTLMVRSFAQALDLAFNRVQFTPDLMPSDITGSEILDETSGSGQRSFRFVRGPVFTNVLLADEINRAPPRTQSALLEAMQEHHVTSGGQTYRLGEPFYVLATQNPIEQEGTYPLPEAQLDRFMFMLWVDYPSADEEVKVVRITTGEDSGRVSTVLERDEIIEAQALVRRVPADGNVVLRAVNLVRRTRPVEGSPDFVRDFVLWGAGPRASQYLILAAKSKALLEGRKTPAPEDVDALALPVLRHRIVTNFNAEAAGVKTPDIIARLLESA